MFSISNGREHFYQWDINQQLVVQDNTITEAHFCNRTDDCALICEVFEKDGRRLVNVPNILLQDNWPIRVYAYSINHTKVCATFKVKPRSKPADYVYTETEVKNWEELEARVDEKLAQFDALEDGLAQLDTVEEKIAKYDALLPLAPLAGVVVAGTNGKSTAFGDNTTASGGNAFAEGGSTIAAGVVSHAEGWMAKASGSHSHAEGNNTEATGTSSHAEGSFTIAAGSASHAEGRDTKANTENAHAEGGSTIADGGSSHAEGWATHAVASCSHAEGNNTKSMGESSHAEGNFTTAGWVGAHAEGVSSNKATDIHSNICFLNYDEIIKIWNETDKNDKTTKFSLAIGKGSHVEGVDCLALGDYAHAEGDRTIASASHSHTEGCNTRASGLYTHAGGVSTTASGYASYAEGYYTKASGLYSHVEGFYTIAASRNQHVQGKYNIEDTKEKYAHIVGNGTAKDKRANAYTLDWSGNSWQQGAIEAAAIILTSPNGTRYKITVADDGTLTTQGV